MDHLSQAIGWTSLVAGVVCLVIALILAVTDDLRKAAKEAAKAVAEKTTTAAKDPTGTFKEQAGALSTGLDGVSKLAGALKDLDRVAQLLVVSLGFFTIAGVVVGLEQVAQAVGS